jgi:hypothetical protein
LPAEWERSAQSSIAGPTNSWSKGTERLQKMDQATGECLNLRLDKSPEKKKFVKPLKFQEEIYA